METNNTNSDFQIVTASAEDVNWMSTMSEREKWNPGLKDAIAFQLVDPNGFFIGLLNGKPVCCIAAVKYPNTTCGYIGRYIVEENHRGKGYGLRIFKHAMEHLTGCCIGLDAVPSQQKNYKKFGFQYATAVKRYIGVIQRKAQICKNIRRAKDISMDKLIEYDARHFPCQRTHFLASWIHVGTDQCLVYIEDDGTIKGLGGIRLGVDGYRVGPLFAETPEIAENLLYALCPSESDTKVDFDIPEPNSDGILLAERLNLQYFGESGRMYTGVIPKLPLSNIFAFASAELG
ncbi:uncharacterized protein TRIADDRAFT_60069 [Trichoplax adhaerens]|uniref:N-acetyltransferase domain-containing protein n=1 Tax=Trichoplax adhaerens TaxID=10228 RepID=B3S775_TRIAD|nr:hypothetical protein TRIADDRAFT_60069 [Trichoplax adhaerens]EDV21522.1 hypothetical protein TRIADDRAFT_60069 [Trichoplax adhaerens]|eukprot:XP_002116122.1 hypothetical protein TRIADDRAFT_60069 [Trichoplax adhaerens]